MYLPSVNIWSTILLTELSIPPVCQYMIYHLTDWAFYTSRLSIYDLPSYWLSFLYLPSVNIWSTILLTELSIPPICQYMIHHLTDWAFYTSRLSIYDLPSYWLSFLYLPSVNIWSTILLTELSIPPVCQYMIYHLTDWAFYTSRLSIYSYWLSFLYLPSVNIMIYHLTDWAFYTSRLSILWSLIYHLSDWAFYTSHLSIYDLPSYWLSFLCFISCRRKLWKRINFQGFRFVTSDNYDFLVWVVFRTVYFISLLKTCTFFVLFSGRGSKCHVWWVPISSHKKSQIWKGDLAIKVPKTDLIFLCSLCVIKQESKGTVYNTF